jgi:radical SAM protein with 4Fe4S-binding SPASM domain
LKNRERLEYLRRVPKIAADAIFRASYSYTFDWMPMTVRNMSLAQRFNLLRAGSNLFYRRAYPLNWPLNMQVELTNFCNIHCPVCPAGTGELTRKPLAMSLDLFDRLMKEVGPYLFTLALWAWGEPLLHPEIEAILRLVRKYPAAVLLSTNGQNLNQKRILEAIQKYPPTYLIVAVDGLCDATNSLYRKGAQLAPLLEGVQALAQWKKKTGSNLPVLHCRFLAMKHNEHEIPELRQFADRTGFDMLSIRGLSIIDSSEEAHHSLLAESEDLRPYAYRNGMRVHRSDFICQHAFSFPTVLADGTVVACEQDFNGTRPFGIFSDERSFRNIWFGPEAAAIRRVIREDPSQYSFCRHCPYADRPISSCSLQAYHLRSINV